MLATLVLALVVRLTHLHALSQTPFFTGLVVDAQAYARDAASLLSHGAVGSGFYRPPLYPYIRAALTLIGLGSPWALGLVHALAGSACAGVLCLVASRLASERSLELRRWSSYAAGIIGALYGPLIVYDVEMLPPVWVNLLIALAYLGAVSPGRRLGPADFASGASLGLATAGWAPSVLLALPMLWLRRTSLADRYRFRGALAFVAAMSLAPSLTALHNARHGEAGIVVSGNLGINLWLGNGPQWRQTVTARPGVHYDLEYRRPTQAGALRLVEREAFYIELVLEHLKSAPFAAFTRAAEKLYLFVHGREIRRDQDMAWLRSRSAVAALSIWERGVLFPFGLLLPLALVCPARVLRPQAKWIVVGGAALYAFALAWFVLGARYRLPIVLLLIPLAAASVASLIARLRGWIRGAHPLVAATSFAAFLGVLVVCNAPNAFSSSFAATPAEIMLLEGQAYASQGELDEALRISRAATEHFPSDPDAHLQLGQLLLRGRRADEAAYHFRRAGHLVPASEAPWVLHGHAMMALGRYEDAIYNFREALQRNPYQHEALRDLGHSYARADRAERAISAFRQYLAAGYRDDEASYELAHLLLEGKQAAQALSILLELQARHPSSPELQRLVTRARSAQ